MSLSVGIRTVTTFYRLAIPDTITAQCCRMRYMTCPYGNGFMNCYTLTDCIQVVSDSLYFFDPAGKYVMTEPGECDGAHAGTARQYRHAGTDLPSRFADQFSPLCWDGSESGVGGGGESTLIRLPLRTKTAKHDGSVHTACWTPESASEVLLEFAAKASHALLFFNKVHTVRVWQRDVSGQRTLVLEAALQPPPVRPLQPQGRNQQDDVPVRRTWFDERDWKRAGSGGGSGSGFFGSIGKQFAKLGQSKDEGKDDGVSKIVEHRIKVLRQAGEPVVQRWIVGVSAGAGGSGGIASDKRHIQMQLDPQAAVAVVLVSDDTCDQPELDEDACGLLGPLPLAKNSGLQQLPFVLCARFALARAGGRRPLKVSLSAARQSDASTETTQQVQSRFNRSLLKCAAAASAAVLERLLLLHVGRAAAGLYHMLPKKLPTDVTGEEQALFSEVSRTHAACQSTQCDQC
jgi:hypothetical protein